MYSGKRRGMHGPQLLSHVELQRKDPDIEHSCLMTLAGILKKLRGI